MVQKQWFIQVLSKKEKKKKKKSGLSAKALCSVIA